MPNRFEIIYDDETVVSGTTATDFANAPATGIQIVIEECDDGTIIKHKALDVYTYQGENKNGSWTDLATFNAIKDKVVELSDLMVKPSMKAAQVRRLNKNKQT